MPEKPLLYLVATPIGNLSDISARALDTLREVDIVACEDTRKTGILLKHFEIKSRLVSFHEHNEKSAGRYLIERMLSGQTVALVTTAGTPGVSDPGFTLVREAIAQGIVATAIPGASALLPALVLSGLPVHSFTFRGFPPRKNLGCKKFFEEDLPSPHTLIYYESPYRIVQTVAIAAEVFGDRPAALARELTKVFEEVRRGTLPELSAGLANENIRGEFVLLIGGAPKVSKSAEKRKKWAAAEEAD